MSDYKSLSEMYEAKKQCNACRLRKGCTQVVAGAGCLDRPILMIIAEAPGSTEDEEGEPLIGQAGETLRAVLRATGVIKRTNTLMTNVLGCRPPSNKFPKDECPEICVSKWLWEEVALANPERLLLLGGTPLKYVADMEGITACRGQWITVRGIRTLPTYHPSYVMRKDGEGVMTIRADFERDIKELAEEVRVIEDERKKQSEGTQQILV